MKILIVDDDRSIRETLSMALETRGYEVAVAADGIAALKKVEEVRPEVVFLDLKLTRESGLDVLTELLKASPRLAVVLMTAYASLETAVEAMRRGAYDYLAKPFKPAQLTQILERLIQTRKLEQRVSELETEARAAKPSFQTNEPAMRTVLELATKAASSQASVLILGESGTGKSVLARHLHALSSRQEAPYVTVSCPSLSRDLLQSELFGHVKGAFTGATTDTWGKVARADGGTLFLDEIGELPLEIQPKLLRLLQEREYERLGENKIRFADVRVISATNRNLREAVAAKSFREDLLYRLNVVVLEMPPLRHRPADILTLAEEQLRFFSKQARRVLQGFTQDAQHRLKTYPWPGNLRELRNVVERSVILADSDQVDLKDLPESLQASAGTEVRLGGDFSLEQIEAEHLRQVLLRGTSIQQASELLGVDPTTLLRKRKKLNLD